MSEITLAQYASERNHVVLWWASVGTPTGAYVPLDAPTPENEHGPYQVVTFAERCGLLDLLGTVDSDGDWQWNGQGEPCDSRANTITRLVAYRDAKRWQQLVKQNVR